MIQSVVASDVGLWMALPAFLPALLVVGVVVVITRRDRRAEADDDAAGLDGA